MMVRLKNVDRKMKIILFIYSQYQKKINFLKKLPLFYHKFENFKRIRRILPGGGV
jgi:hypothetical protein